MDCHKQAKPRCTAVECVQRGPGRSAPLRFAPGSALRSLRLPGSALVASPPCGLKSLCAKHKLPPVICDSHLPLSTAIKSLINAVGTHWHGATPGPGSNLCLRKDEPKWKLCEKWRL